MVATKFQPSDEFSALAIDDGEVFIFGSLVEWVHLRRSKIVKQLFW